MGECFRLHTIGFGGCYAIFPGRWGRYGKTLLRLSMRCGTLEICSTLFTIGNCVSILKATSRTDHLLVLSTTPFLFLSSLQLHLLTLQTLTAMSPTETSPLKKTYIDEFNPVCVLHVRLEFRQGSIDAQSNLAV